MSEPDPRYLADVMLGRLARWLRALGYDTRYEPALDDAALAELARREDRILLTRDVELTRRRKLRAFLIHDDKVMQQLRQVMAAFGLNTTTAFTRCIECNAELVAIGREDAASLVPPYVFKTQAQFRQCPRCGKVYWRGSHWMRMQNVVRELENHEE